MNLADVLAESHSLAQVGVEELAALAGGFDLVRLGAGESLVRQGEEGSDLFVVLSGSLTAVVEDDAGEHIVSRRLPGDVVGETSMIFGGGRRTATVRAESDVEVARLSADQFRSLVAARPSLADSVSAEAYRRLLEGHLAAVVHRVFGAVDGDLSEEIRRSAEWMQLPAGGTLFSEGDPADAAYLVVLGRLRLCAGGQTQVFDEVGSGEVIGAGALLEGGVRKATVFAARDSYLVRLRRSTVEKIVELYPASALRLARTLIAQLKPAAGPHRAINHLSIAVVPGSDGVDVRLFIARLIECMSRHGSAFHVWSARADSVLHTPGISQAEKDDPARLALTRWLHELESAHRIIVYEADPSWSAWTRLALRQADRVLVVVAAKAQPPGRIAEPLGRFLPEFGRPRVGLVLLQEAGVETPTGTAAWLDALEVDDHFHVRTGSARDVSRLARIVAGHAVALVLSGGGARGFAHLGVIRALHELGIPIDLVGGTSNGAIMGTVAATEIPVDEIVDVVGRHFSKLRDYTLPVASILKGRRTAREIKAQFGDLRIEDMWLPYFCVSTNLTRSCAQYHRRGPLLAALRASTSIPGVFPPVPIDGDFHVDGGVLDNLPVREMHRWHPGATIIAVDVVPPMGLRAKTDYGFWLKGSTALWGRLKPGSKRQFPGIVETLVRATIVASVRERDAMVKEQLADLYLPLDLRGVNLLDFDAVPEIAARGYEQAIPLLTAWCENSGNTLASDARPLQAHVSAHTA